MIQTLRIQAPRFLTVGAVAQHFGCRPWQVRRAIDRGLLDEPPRLGVYRVFLDEDLPRVEAALRLAGYLPEVEGGDDAP